MVQLPPVWVENRLRNHGRIALLSTRSERMRRPYGKCQIMAREGIRQALAYDHRFQPAGFDVLLRDT